MQPRLGWPTWLGVVVDDLEGAATFYEALGLRRSDTGGDWIQFDLDGRTFELLERSALPQYDARRFQVGFAVTDIEATRDALVAAGAIAISGIEGDRDSPNRWCYFRDPEGNVFEITAPQHPREGDSAQG